MIFKKLIHKYNIENHQANIIKIKEKNWLGKRRSKKNYN